jgi:hypothetical protein
MTATTSHNRSTLLAALDKFIRSRPGFDWRNYGDASSYRADLRLAAKQREHALRMLSAVEGRSISVADLIAACGSGRLTIEPVAQGYRIDYTAGQYWCTEYRAGVCRVLAGALWAAQAAEGLSADAIRRNMRLRFGAGLQRVWFN